MSLKGLRLAPTCRMPMPPCILRAHRVRQALTPKVSTQASARHAQATLGTPTQSRQVSLRVFAMLDGLESQQTAALSVLQEPLSRRLGVKRVKFVETTVTHTSTLELYAIATKDFSTMSRRICSATT